MHYFIFISRLSEHIGRLSMILTLQHHVRNLMVVVIVMFLALEVKRVH